MRYGLDFKLNESADYLMTTSTAKGNLVVAPRGILNLIKYNTCIFRCAHVFVSGIIIGMTSSSIPKSLYLYLYVNETNVGQIALTTPSFKHSASFDLKLKANDRISFKIGNEQLLQD